MFIRENKQYRTRSKIAHLTPDQSLNDKSLVRSIQDMCLYSSTLTIVTTHLARTMYANQYLTKVQMGMLTTSLTIGNPIHVIDTLNLKWYGITSYLNWKQVTPFISNWF